MAKKRKTKRTVKTKRTYKRKTNKMARRKSTRRYTRRGSTINTKITKVLAGIGASSIVGGGILGYAASYFVGDIEGVAGAFIAPQLSGLNIGNLTSQISNNLIG